MNEFTVKEYADAERVTRRTVERWIEKGAVPVRRTPGGGLRIQADRPNDTTKDDRKRQLSR